MWTADRMFPNRSTSTGEDNGFKANAEPTAEASGEAAQALGCIHTH